MIKGDEIQLKKQVVKVVECEDCQHLMVNIDADQIEPGDLSLLKKAGVRLSNPETEEKICLFCEVPKKKNFRDRLNDWFENEDEDDDDSGFFHTPTMPSTPIFGGGSFGGGFSGFGGGSFSGGGASRGF